jgi:proteasome lid subunit RPN8/RPN11
MTLRLHAADLRRIQVLLCRAYPEEGCGVLIGREEGGVRAVERVVGFENQVGEERHRRYVISPEQFLEAERQARAEGLDVLGIVHSHPDHPAEPSSFDLEHAWPYYSYMIVSVSGGAAADQRSWRLRDDRSGFDPERLEFTPGAATPVAGA